tara:strand:+ start:93 stop:464 length:372 start_codon:yes stop_codon:yes gene_type:complete
MTIEVKHIDTLPNRSKAQLLKGMIGSAFLWWYKDVMRELDIQGRTRLYQVFSWSSWQQDQRDSANFTTGDRQLEAVETLLSQSDIATWVDHYLKHFTLNSFQQLYLQAIPQPVDNMDLRVIFD